MRTKTYLFIMAFFAMLTTMPTLKGQVIVTNILQTYEQDFDSFGTNNVVWTDNVTLPGWYAAQFSGPVTNLPPNDGSTSMQTVFNYGTVDELDRALGSFESFNSASFYGVRFTNNSSSTLTSITVNYIGEQWTIGFFAGLTTNQFFYRVGGTTFETNNTDWTAFPALDFTNLHTALFGGVLNGNSVTNQVVLQANIPVTVSNNQEVWIKWFYNPPAFGHGLAVDDVQVSFTGVPEIAPDNNTLNFGVELRRPKQAKTLKFDGSKGFKVSGRIKGTNTVSTISYTAFGGTNISTNSTFIALGKVKLLTKGKLFKKGYIATFKTKGNSNKVGQGIVSDANPVTLIIKVDGTGTSNQVGSFKTNFVFANTKVK